jgi:hypothetical protein
MEETLVKKKTLWRKYWYIMPIIFVLFVAGSIPVYAYITGYNVETVGQTLYNLFSVGSGVYALMVVGGYSTNQVSNSLAQNILPVIAVVVIIMYAFKSMLLESGFTGMLKTLLLIVVGAIMLGAVVVILSQLT